MKVIKKIMKNNPEKISEGGNWLTLAKKDERGVPMPTGVHFVKLIKGEMTERENFRGIKEEGVLLYFEEDGVEKKYFVPQEVNDKNSDNYGKFHYLFQRFADIEEGEELEMEFVRKGKAGYIEVRRQGEKVDVDESEIPVIEDEINPEDIPF